MNNWLVPFWVHGNTSNKFDRQLLYVQDGASLHTPYQESRPCGCRQHAFFYGFPKYPI